MLFYVLLLFFLIINFSSLSHTGIHMLKKPHINEITGQINYH